MSTDDVLLSFSRGDTISVYSATFVAAEMTPQSAGYWLITDMVGDNLRSEWQAGWQEGRQVDSQASR